LGIRGAIAKDLRISDSTNANTRNHNGNDPKEPTVDVGAI
jgi:hypothetical protein